jgi:branched-chain amino acid transport system substrate-binding protein
VLALVLVFGVTGCSGGSKASDETGGTNTKTVKIGFAAPLTGDNAIYGEGMKRAVELAIAEANASDEVKNAGITFALHAEDDAGDPKQAVNAANAIVADTAVIGVVGHFNSGCSIPAAPVYDAANIAMVTVSSNPALTAVGLKNVDRIVAKDTAQGAFAGKMAYDMGFKKVALIDDGTAYGQGLAAEFKKAFAAAGGSLVAEDRIAPKEVDFSALVTKLKQAAPVAVYYAGAHTEGALLGKQMRESGLEVPLIGGDMLYTPDFIKLAGENNAAGDIATALGLPLDQQPRGKEFAQKYQAEYNKAPEAYDSYAYDAAWCIINAAVRSGIERAQVEQGVRAGSVDGVTGTIAFDKNGDNMQQIISAYKVVGDEWKQIQQ